MSRYQLLFAFIFLFACALTTKADDSIKVRQLDEVVVKSSRAWIENDKAIFIPTRHEKNLANSIETLIKNMHLPVIRSVKGVLTGRNGESITYFINGVKADDIDASTFWPKEVRRVEYIENPTEPTYEGVKVAVNLVTSKYVVGGVTKLDLFQKIPNSGYHTVSSKLVYKKMTFGALVNGNYSRDHRSGSWGTETYKNLFYNGDYFDEINRSTTNHSWERSNNISAAFNARYQTKNFRATHTAAFLWQENPGSGNSGTNTWNPNLFSSSSSYSHSDGRNVSPQISGSYYTAFSKKWVMTGLWSYAYSHNNFSVRNSLGGAEETASITAEDVNSFRVQMKPFFLASNHWTFNMSLSTAMDWYSSHYGGTTTADTHQRRGESRFALAAYWSPKENLQLSLSPGLYVSYWKIGTGKSEYLVRPTVNISANYNPNKKLSLGLTTQFYAEAPEASQSTEAVIKQSELSWRAGNPNLKNLTSLDSYLYATWLTADWLSMNVGLGYTTTQNSLITLYTSANKEMGGMIEAFTNARPIDNLRANYSITGDFLDDKLSVSLTPEWYFTKTRGAYATTFNYLSFSADAEYSFGDNRFHVWYEGPFKDIDMAGMEKSWKQGCCNAEYTYGNGNIYLSFRVENIFNEYNKRWERLNAQNYSFSKDMRETGRTFAINLTYTFGYGKKTDRDISIDSPSEIKSSIVGSAH